jgi:hypothetical protein
MAGRWGGRESPHVVSKDGGPGSGPHKGSGFGGGTESGLEPHHPRVVHGAKGMQSKPFSKRFANENAMNKWMDKEEGNHDIHRIDRDYDRMK